MFPRSLGWTALVLATILLAVNVGILRHGLDWIVENDHLLPPMPQAPDSG
ncbi:MAG: hypothetical protein GY895_10725 [Phycisphaera sp.]|nr:hypothetical protein [Phycisphaera sp.]